MKRQSIRKMVLIISMLLFPITIWHMSSYLIIQGVMESIITGSFIVFISLLILSIFFGRLFCSWLCPMGIDVKKYTEHGKKITKSVFNVEVVWIIVLKKLCVYDGVVR